MTRKPNDIRNLSAQQVAALLKQAGLPVIKFAEGDDVEDGEVTLTAAITVQVPTFGGPIGLVVENGETFTFHPARFNVADIVADFRVANGAAS